MIERYFIFLLSATPIVSSTFMGFIEIIRFPTFSTLHESSKYMSLSFSREYIGFIHLLLSSFPYILTHEGIALYEYPFFFIF